MMLIIIHELYIYIYIYIYAGANKINIENYEWLAVNLFTIHPIWKRILWASMIYDGINGPSWHWSDIEMILTGTFLLHVIHVVNIVMSKAWCLLVHLIFWLDRFL